MTVFLPFEKLWEAVDERLQRISLPLFSLPPLSYLQNLPKLWKKSLETGFSSILPHISSGRNLWPDVIDHDTKVLK